MSDPSTFDVFKFLRRESRRERAKIEAGQVFCTPCALFLLGMKFLFALQTVDSFFQKKVAIM